MSPFNPFSFPPSVPFTAAFISARSLNLPWALICNPAFSPALWQAPSHFLHLSVIFLPLLSTSRALFSRRLLPSQTFPPFYWHIFLCFSPSFSARTRFHSVKRTPSALPFQQKGLHGPIKFPSLMSFPTLHTWADWTVQLVQGQTRARATFRNVARKKMWHFSFFLAVSLNCVWALHWPAKEHYLYTLSWQGTSSITTCLDSSCFGGIQLRIAFTKQKKGDGIFNSKECKPAASALY